MCGFPCLVFSNLAHFIICPHPPGDKPPESSAGGRIKMQAQQTWPGHNSCIFIFIISSTPSWNPLSLFCNSHHDPSATNPTKSWFTSRFPSIVIYVLFLYSCTALVVQSLEHLLVVQQVVGSDMTCDIVSYSHHCSLWFSGWLRNFGSLS